MEVILGRDYPAMVDHTATPEPVPRRIRGYFNGVTVFDTTRAVYVWDTPKYPAYYVPRDDLDTALLSDGGEVRHLRRGRARAFALRVDGASRPGAVQVYESDADPAVADRARIEWTALDAWFEEDEQVFVHPRNPYTRVDALRSSRDVRLELDGVVLARSASTVMVFETGLRTRYYFQRTSVDLGLLTPSPTVTECPYKGRTSSYWSARVGDREVADIAWSYDFPTRQLSPISGLVAFYDEHLDLLVDGVAVPRPDPA